MGEDRNPFWHFSWNLYHADGVADACLALQAREGLDVNLLLFCCWAGWHGRRLSEADLATLVAAAADWQERVVQPLREVRTWLKEQDRVSAESAETLREAVKAQELEAERLEQDLLDATLSLPEGRPDVGAVSENLQTYFTVHGRVPGPDDTAALAMLVLATCPGAGFNLDVVTRLEDAR